MPKQGNEAMDSPRRQDERAGVGMHSPQGFAAMVAK